MSVPSLGLALSGGTAKSVTHVGVIKALVESRVPISYICGTSGGSMVAAMHASGMPVSTLESIATTMSWRKLVSIRLTRLGFISSQRIEDFMEETIGDVDFSELSMPCGVVATDLLSGEKRMFTKGSVARAVRASCSIPQIYLPVEIDGNYYVDGGLAEYLPVESLLEMGTDFALASNLAPHDVQYRRPHHILQLVIQVTGLMARRNLVDSLPFADFVIHPNVDSFGSFDFDNASDLIQVGYETTMRALPEIERAAEQAGSVWRRVRRRLGFVT